MKKNSLVLLTFCITFFISCQKENVENSNLDENNFTTSGWPPYTAPPGYHWTIHYYYNDFNFHRPKYNCERGFWFCFPDGYWQWELTSNWPVSSISGSTAHIWGKYIENDKVELHFPLELKGLQGYEPNDFFKFSVDDTMYLEQAIILKIGEYDVSETQTEIVTIVDIVNL